MTARCAHCGAVLDGKRWRDGRFCSRDCLEKYVGEVIERVMREPAETQIPQGRDGSTCPRGRPRTRVVSWCRWCGEKLPLVNGRRFCGAECRQAHKADVAASALNPERAA